MNRKNTPVLMAYDKEQGRNRFIFARDEHGARLIFTDHLEKAQRFTSESYDYFDNWFNGEIMVWLESERAIIPVYTDENYYDDKKRVHYL